MKFTIIWYDQDSEKRRDVIDADSEDEALRKATLKYNGKPPAPLHTVIKGGN